MIMTIITIAGFIVPPFFIYRAHNPIFEALSGGAIHPMKILTYLWNSNGSFWGNDAIPKAQHSYGFSYGHSKET